MRIIVCIKQVPDPEGPRDSFLINEEDIRVEPKGIPPVLSLFDENALEAALRIKDADKENVRVSVLSIGKRVSNAVMIKALAAGADELLKVEDPLFESEKLDSFATASILASAIKNSGGYDLILVGRQAADWNAGQVGINIAGILDISCVTLAQKVEPEGDMVHVERVLPDGNEVVRTKLPAVVMVSNELGELRYPAMKERRSAKKKPVTAWDIGDIGFEGLPKNKVSLKRLYTPEIKASDCLMIQGGSPEETGNNLALKLKEDGVI